MAKQAIHLLPKPYSLDNCIRLMQSWTKDGSFSKVLHLYSSMFNSGFHGNSSTYAFVFKSCASIGLLNHGKKIHGHIILLGFGSDVFVQTSLIDMTAKCGSLLDARKLFDGMRNKNSVSWNCMISGYVKKNQLGEGFKLFNEMRKTGFHTSPNSIVSLVSGCTKSILDLKHGPSIYAFVIKSGFDSELKVCNSILTMFAQFGQLNDAQHVFDEMNQKSIVTYTAISCGYTQKGDYNKVFELFNNMGNLGLKPDHVYLVNLLSSCVQLENLLVTRNLHGLILKYGFNHKRDILPPLINLYAKCNDLASSRIVFDLAINKDIFTWTSMISGYVRNNCNEKAFSLFDNLLRSNVKPNSVTICTILSSCANISSIEMGKKIEKFINENGFESDLKIRTGLINMHCKCGNVEKGREIFERILNKDLTVWSTMLNGYACHGKGKETLNLFEKMLTEDKINPDNIIFTHVLSACSHSVLLNEGLRWFNKMQVDYDIKPSIEHFMCVINMLSKHGKFELVLKFINEMPDKLRNQVWGPVFSALRENCNCKFGERVLRERKNLGIEDGGNYVLMANLKSLMGKWNEAEEFRGVIDERELVKKPGWSRIS